MKTKREVLEQFAKEGHCTDISCGECPYEKICGISNNKLTIKTRLQKIGAMVILRQNRKPKKREFNSNKVLTCVTADKAKVGMKGCFADSLVYLKEAFARKEIHVLTNVYSEDVCARFEANKSINWTLFYPIDEGEE